MSVWHVSTDELIVKGLITRHGSDAARQYARQTRRVYRRAVLNPKHFAATAQYRRSFVMSYLFYKHYLQTHILPPDAAGTPKSATRKSAGKHTDEQFIDERERCIDEELSASMPASDPPSWTLGGSAISRRRPH